MSVLVSWNVVTTLWAVWLLYWILSAWGVRRDERAESTGNRFLTTLILGCGAFLIFARSPRLGILDERFVPAADGIRAPALVLIGAGLGISVWARRHIGQFWSARVTLKADHQLIQTGPYARVRHPIYSGIFLAMMGTALFVGEWRALLGVAVFFLGHWLKARREEALLEQKFGEAYKHYRMRTGSLLPRFR